MEVVRCRIADPDGDIDIVKSLQQISITLKPRGSIRSVRHCKWLTVLELIEEPLPLGPPTLKKKAVWITMGLLKISLESQPWLRGWVLILWNAWSCWGGASLFFHWGQRWRSYCDRQSSAAEDDLPGSNLTRYPAAGKIHAIKHPHAPRRFWKHSPFSLPKPKLCLELGVF